jgi:hypothetical protein
MTEMKLIIRAIPFIFTGMILTAPSIAATQTVDFYEKSCASIARELHDLIYVNSSSPCVGDLDIVSAHIEVADLSLHNAKIEQALQSLDYASRELNEISYIRTYCAPIAPSAKHILADVIRTRGDIESWKRMQDMNKKTV